MTVTIYADGSSRKTGEGGYGFVILRNGLKVREGSGWEKISTNNRMELTGVITPLEYLLRGCAATGLHIPKISIWSDSEYVINSFNKNWLANWKQYGWNNSSGEPVKNRDLWEHIDRLALLCKESGIVLEWNWCRGHNGDEWNEYVDKLAQAASTFAKSQPCSSIM